MFIPSFVNARGLRHKKNGASSGDEVPFQGGCPAEIAEIAEMFHWRSLSSLLRWFMASEGRMNFPSISEVERILASGK